MEKIIFFVCGTEKSGVGIRGKHFREYFDSKIFYREGGIINFFKQFNQIKKLNPKNFYMLDIGQRGLMTYLLLRIFGKKSSLILDTGDIPHMILKLHHPKKILNRVTMYLTEKILLKMSSKIIVRGSYHKKILKKYKNVYLIPDGVIVNDFKNPKKQLVKKLKQKHNQGNFLTFGLMGSINILKKTNHCSGLETINILNKLKKFPLKAIIIGDGDGLNYLKKIVKQKKLEKRVEFLGRIDYNSLPEYMRLIDICLIPLSEDDSMEVRTTGKFPLYLASERYIISTQIGDAKNYIKENGIIIPYKGLNDSSWENKISEHLKKIIKDRKILNKSKIGPKIALKNFDYSKLFEKLEKIILP